MADVEWVGGRTPRVRNVVTRADGKLVNVGRQLGQLFVCAYGCCCGKPEGGHPEGHDDLFHNEWERRKLRNRVHLNMGGWGAVAGARVGRPSERCGRRW